MKQLGLKLPEEEMIFLEWYSEQYATPKSVIYRETTLAAFRTWKQNFLIKRFEEGGLGFKQFCGLANLSLVEGMNLVETSRISPVVPLQIDEYTEGLLSKNLEKPVILKTGKEITRSTKK